MLNAVWHRYTRVVEEMLSKIHFCGFVPAFHPVCPGTVHVIQEIQLRQPQDRSLYSVFQKVSGKEHPVNPIASAIVCVLSIMDDIVSKACTTDSLKCLKEVEVIQAQESSYLKVWLNNNRNLHLHKFLPKLISHNCWSWLNSLGWERWISIHLIMHVLWVMLLGGI